MSGLLQRLVRPFSRRYWLEKWDWMIYHYAHHSIRRMCERNGGFAYLFELWIRQWRKENPIPRSLESATEHFFEDTGGSREVVDEASWFRSEGEPKPETEPLMDREAMDFIDGISEQFGERVYDEAFDLAKARGSSEVTLGIARDAAEVVIESWKNIPAKPLA